MPVKEAPASPTLTKVNIFHWYRIITAHLLAIQWWRKIIRSDHFKVSRVYFTHPCIFSDILYIPRHVLKHSSANPMCGHIIRQVCLGNIGQRVDHITGMEITIQRLSRQAPACPLPKDLWSFQITGSARPAPRRLRWIPGSEDPPLLRLPPVDSPAQHYL